MIEEVKKFEDPSGNVWKYVFHFKDAIAEAVLYKYGTFHERTVMCVSVQSGCPVGCVFCFPENTKILMEDFTYKNIQDIKSGDIVIGNQLTKASNKISQYSSQYSTITPVLNTFSREYNGKLLTLTTSSGKVIELTEEHPIAVKNNSIYRTKFIEANKVNIGDKVLVSDYFNVNNYNSLEWKAGWLSGFVKGDGTYSKRKNKNCYRWSISQSNWKIINYAKDLCKEFNILTTNIWDQLSNISDKINYRFEFGQSGINNFNKMIEENFNSSDYKKGFLAGFWDAEGFSFSNNKSVRVCNNNENLLKEFELYCNELGYESYWDYSKPNIRLDIHMSRLDFLRTCTPLHPKKNYIKDIRSKSLLQFEEIVSIEESNYEGKVYNFETSENTYIANNILVHNCGTGKKFIRNLTWKEIISQVEYLVDEIYTMEDFVNPIEEDCKKFQIMFMSMGEPMLNFFEVSESIHYLASYYYNAQLLLSTIGIKNATVLGDLLELSKTYNQVGLQFSIHDGMDEPRNELIPFKNKMTLREIRDYGIHWNKATKRPVYLNYCITVKSAHPEALYRLMELFSPESFYFTFSVVCESEEGKNSNCDMEILQKVQQQFMEEGYNVRIFDPAGKDSIGAGCGQLWYVQDYFKTH